MTSRIVYNGDLRTTATHLSSGNNIETDAPIDNQGKGERFSPTDLVATALGNCMLTIMGIKAKEMGVSLLGTTVDVTKKMALEPRRIGGIVIAFNFAKDVLYTEKEKTVLERAANTCPVFYSLHPNIVIDVTFNW
jgi:putative redox protein